MICSRRCSGVGSSHNIFAPSWVLKTQFGVRTASVRTQAQLMRSDFSETCVLSRGVVPAADRHLEFGIVRTTCVLDFVWAHQ